MKITLHQATFNNKPIELDVFSIVGHMVDIDDGIFKTRISTTSKHYKVVETRKQIMRKLGELKNG